MPFGQSLLLNIHQWLDGKGGQKMGLQEPYRVENLRLIMTSFESSPAGNQELGSVVVSG